MGRDRERNWQQEDPGVCMGLFEIFGNRESSVVVSVPHNGACIPERIRAQLAIVVERAWERVDTYADELAFAMEEHATIIKADVARVVIDLNRSGTVSELDLTAETEHERDRLVRLYDDHGRDRWKAPVGEPYITREELECRIREYYDPYHAALQECLGRAKKPRVLVDMHSMSDPAFEIVIGDSRGQSTGVEICERRLKPFFVERGYRVGYAGPENVDRRGRPVARAAIRYSGGFITSRYGNPASGEYAFQIEVNREACRRNVERMREDFGVLGEFLHVSEL